MKKIEIRGDLVHKTSGELGAVWRRKFRKIMEFVDVPALVSFLPMGYVTQYIDGVDLQEDKPFEPRHDVVRSYPLNKVQREGVIDIFRSIVWAGIKTNYTLADFTKRNIIIKDDTPYLIDYDVIIKGKLPQDYIDIFQRMLDYLEIDYKFTGDLKELYERLS